MLWQEFLVVELSDFLLWVKFKSLIRIPWLAIHILKELPLFLAWFWNGLSASLTKEEWHSEEFLFIRRIEFLFSTKSLNGLSISLQILINLINKLLMRLWGCWLLGIMSLIDESLNLNWVALGGNQSLLIDICNILKTVNLTKCPEEVILVLAGSLNLELLLESWVNWSSVGNSIQKLSLGHWTRLVDIQIILNTLLGVSLSS